MVDQAKISELKETLRGDVIEPQDATYDEVRKLYNGMIDKRPRLIAQCTDATIAIVASN